MNKDQKQFRKLAREAVKLYREKEWVASIAKWDEIISLLQDDPTKASVYTRRGNAKDEAGDHKGAIADYNQALEIRPQYPRAYSNRGITKHNMGDHKGAIADYNQALEIRPQYANAYNNRGNAKDSMGDHEGAIADFDRALEISPQHAARFYSNRGVAKDSMGDYEGAIADYNRALEIDPQYAVAYDNRGVAKGNMGDHEGAIADHRRALQIDPKNKNALRNHTIARSMRRESRKGGKKIEEQLRAQQEKFDLTMQKQLRAQQEKFDLTMQKQLQAQQKEFDLEQQKQLKKQQEKLNEKFAETFKAASDVAKSLQYKENCEDYNNKTDHLGKYVWRSSCVLVLMAVVVYVGIAYFAFTQWKECDKPCEIEGSAALSLFPFILMGTLLLSPLVWIIRMLNRDRHKYWALREDALANLSMARIIQSNPPLREKFSERLFDHHSKRKNVDIILDGNHADTDGGIFVSVQDIAKEIIKRFKPGGKGGDKGGDS